MSFTPINPEEAFGWQAINQRFEAISVPRGIIANWYGSLNSIPEGWRLCDGTGGTPDLRDRFVVGAGNAYAVGARGGEPTHTLVARQEIWQNGTR